MQHKIDYLKINNNLNIADKELSIEVDIENTSLNKCDEGMTFNFFDGTSNFHIDLSLKECDKLHSFLTNYMKKKGIIA